VKLPATLAGLVEELASRAAAPALVAFRPDGVRTWSAGELVSAARRLAAGLSARGLEAGAHALLLAPNSPEWIIAALALIEARAVPVPVDVQLREDELAHVIGDCQPRLVVTVRDLARRLDERGLAPGGERLVLDASGDGGSHDPGTAAAAGAAGVRPAARAPDDPAVLFYTSGTTGTPKGVPLSHRNLLANLDALLGLGLVGDDDRVLLPLPLHHIYPFTVGLLAPLAAGAVVVLPHALTGPELLRALREGEVTAIVGVPRLYTALAGAIRSRVRERGGSARALFAVAVALSGGLARLGIPAGRWLFRPLRRQVAPRLRLLASGGAALELALARRLAALGWQVASGYGLTETSPILTFTTPGRLRPGSAGRALPGVQLRIAPPVEGATHGEVLARGPNVFAGYLHLPAATREAFTDDGWFRTGDLGYLDAAGDLYLVGRASAMIVRPSGENVWPEEVETVLERSPSIKEAAVLERDGQLAALIVPAPTGGGAAGADGLEALIRGDVEARLRELPSHHRFGEWAVTTEPLPRTRLGKLRRHELAAHWERARAGIQEQGPVAIAELSPEDRALLEHPAARAVWDGLARRYPAARLTPDTHLELDLGIDSLGWLELTFDLRERIGRDLDEQVIARVERVRDLLQEAAAAGPSTAAAADLATSLAHPGDLLDERERRWLVPPGSLTRALGALTLGLARLVIPPVFRLDVRGREHLPAKGAFVLTPNHASLLDAPALAAALPRDLLRRTWWGGWTGIMFANPAARLLSRATRVVPVDPRRGPLASLAFGAALLRQGQVVVWFPEGERSASGRLGQFRPGVGLLLDACQVPAVPAWIAGSHAALPRGAWWPRRAPIRVMFGPAVAPDVLAGEGTGDEAHLRVAAALRNRVAALGGAR
jgi:long-chain acyl-CoA synthetase